MRMLFSVNFHLDEEQGARSLTSVIELATSLFPHSLYGRATAAFCEHSELQQPSHYLGKVPHNALLQVDFYFT